MTDELYIFKKVVDWSLLHEGITIPISLIDIFLQNITIKLERGNRKKVCLFVDGIKYFVFMNNVDFNKAKYPTHSDILQFRYSPKSQFAEKMRSMFFKSYRYLQQERSKPENKRKIITLPENEQEYLVFYATSIEDVFVADCITSEEINDTRMIVKSYSEYDLEQILSMRDESSELIKKEKIVKIRKLDRTIGEGIKKIYEYKCQICGLHVGELYGATVINTHHIEPFSTSLNNNPENILVICPNHHGIIHDTNPIFYREQKVFKYPNGYAERLKINKHL